LIGKNSAQLKIVQIVHVHLKWPVIVVICHFYNTLFSLLLCSPYCSITQSSSGHHQVVDFMSMTCGVSEVRRLSTASSVTKPPHFILTTEWIWYWRNDKGGWTEYGQGVSDTFTTQYLLKNDS